MKIFILNFFWMMTNEYLVDKYIHKFPNIDRYGKLVNLLISLGKWFISLFGRLLLSWQLMRSFGVNLTGTSGSPESGCSEQFGL